MKSARDTERPIWQVNALLTGGVMITVLLALMLAQLDILQARAALTSPGLPIVNIQATAIAIGRVIPWDLNPEGPLPVEQLAGPVPDDLNPRPEFITGVGEDGAIFTVCGEVPEGWLLYTVQPGETLASLAAGTQAAAAELAAANCLGEGQLAAGMQILVPREPAQSLCGPPSWWVRYQIRSGDTLGALAASRGTTIDEVLRANCRESLDLLAGQFIFLPPGGAPDSPGSIAQPSLTPLPTATAIPTVAPIPTVTNQPPPPPPPPPPSPTPPVVVTSVPPTATPPPLPTEPPPTWTPQPPPTDPPPTDPPPTEPPATDTPPPVPTEPPPTWTPQPPPTDPPPTDPPPTAPPDEGEGPP
jgi:LysM repeat protein